jgi:C4-dicarboxylate-specific signal transduction histidine kinase
VELSGVRSARLGQAATMSTPIRVGEIRDYPRPESSEHVTGSQMQDSRALLEQLLQVARISALEEMASGIAHELNQPIGAITTFAQAGQRMLERPEPLVEPAAEVLRYISNEALNAGEGIRRIRSLFHGHHAERTGCNLADVIAELLPILKLLASRGGGTLHFSAQSGLPAVAIDRLRIQHVLFTLVQNALEAPTHDGEAPNVRIDLTGDRYGVVVAVEDRGMGIPDEAREQLFRPFFTTKAHGTGLGLASSRAIAELHEGSLDVENVAGGGTRFCLRLPAQVKEEEIAP